jgi:hypothetical protein
MAAAAAIAGRFVDALLTREHQTVPALAFILEGEVEIRVGGQAVTCGGFCRRDRRNAATAVAQTATFVRRRRFAA